MSALVYTRVGRESGVSERVRGAGFGVFFTTVSAMGKPSGRRGVLRDTGVRGWASVVGSYLSGFLSVRSMNIEMGACCQV